MSTVIWKEPEPAKEADVVTDADLQRYANPWEGWDYTTMMARELIELRKPLWLLEGHYDEGDLVWQLAFRGSLQEAKSYVENLERVDYNAMHVYLTRMVPGTKVLRLQAVYRYKNWNHTDKTGIWVDQ